MLRIRRYQPEDNEVVKALHYIGLVQTGTRVIPFRYADLDDIENAYINNRGDFLVGLFDDRIVAIGALRKFSETCGEIKRMRVHSDYQRRGFGEQILTELIQVARNLGYKELCLDTMSQMLPARSLYKKYGFVEERREKFGEQEIVYYRTQIDL